MSTNNFYNHKNGIYLVPEYTYEDIKEMLLDNDYSEEEITDELIQSEHDFYSEMTCEEFLQDGCHLNYWLEEKGYKTIQDERNRYKAKVFNKGGKLLAELRLESGYYTGCQVIVETDIDVIEPWVNDYEMTKAEINNMYSPHHKRLLKAIAEYTTPLIKVGQFSNGEAIYKYA